MTPEGYALIGLTAIVALLVAVLAFAVLRFVAAARDSRRHLAEHRSESMLFASALEEAVAKLKAQERAMAARAEASEQLSSQIVRSLASGLIVVDGSGVARIVNPAAERILELEHGPGIAYTTLLARHPPLAAVIARSLVSGEPIRRHLLRLDRPRGTMHLGVSVSVLTPDRGGGTGVICLFSDLTAVVVREEQLRLKEALARLGELIAGLAHEFRNGLATIHGYARLLDPAVLPEPQRAYVEGLRAETDALGEVVTNFLNFARPTAIAAAPIDLRALVERAAADVPGTEIATDGDFATVEGDEVLLRQALSNLFRNSVEACGGAGISAEIRVDARVDRTRGEAIIAVSDNGPGLANDALPHVFQPFFTSRPRGTGLGLAIVQKVVVSHNGRVTAGNSPGGGALFTITLPLRLDQYRTEP